MPQIGRTGWLWFVAWLGVLPAAVARAGLLAESDTFWQIRTGELILRTLRIPAVDPFSWTAHGRPWRPNSWAFDVLLALAYRPGGFTAVALAGSALTMVAVAAQLVLAWRLGAHPVAAGLVILVTTPLLGVWYAVRPQLVDYAAVPVLLVLVEAVVTGRRRMAALAGIAALEAVWINLHATALLGVALAGVMGAVAVSGTALRRPLRRPELRWPELRRPELRWPTVGWAAAPAAAALLGTAANPYGLTVISQGWHVGGASTGIIVEWQPHDFSEPIMDLTLAVGLAALALAVRRRWWRPAAVLLTLIVAGVAVRRFQPILAVCAVPVLAAALDTEATRRWAASRRLMLRIGASVLVIAYAVLAVRALPHLGRTLHPVDAVRALPAGCRLFNSYDLGGIVILLRPDVPVSLDSRNDLYGRRDVVAFERILRGREGGPQRLAELGVTCVFVPSSAGLAGQLARDDGWRAVTRNRKGTLFLRTRDLDPAAGP